MKLTKESPISPVFAFEGVRNILITGGVGTLTIERSICNGDFYPLSTNISGGVAVFQLDGGCAYNGTLEELCNETEYRFVADLTSGEVEVLMTRSLF